MLYASLSFFWKGRPLPVFGRAHQGRVDVQTEPG